MTFAPAQTKPLYSQEVASHFLSHSEIAPIKTGIGFVFPGQGAMYPGMARHFKEDAVFKYFFNFADQIAQKYGYIGISDYAFSPEKLTLEAKEKLESIALFTFEIALTHKLIKENIIPVAITGHSFGEYAALTVAGALTFEEGLTLVITRESLLPPKNEKGYMIAVGCSREILEPVLKNNKYFLSNINTESQTVISTSWEELSACEKKLHEAKIKFKRLSSPQPFHSPFLQETASTLLLVVTNQIKSTTLRYNVFSSVTKSWLPKGEDIKSLLPQLIGNQLIEPVNFVLQVTSLAQNCNQILELGPRPFLLKMIEENIKDPAISIRFGQELVNSHTSKKNVPSVEREQVSDTILNKVNSIISKFTGYSIAEIKFEDRLQEDLGIDSIKTMEICVELIDNLNLPREALTSVQKVKSVGEVAYYVEHFKKEGLSPSQTKPIQEFDVFHSVYKPQPFPQVSSSFHNPGSFSGFKTIGVTDLSLLFEQEKYSLNFLLLTFDRKKQTLNFSFDFFKTFRNALDKNIISPKTKIGLVVFSSNESYSGPLLSFLNSLKKERLISFASRIVFEDDLLEVSQINSLALNELILGSNSEVMYDHNLNRHIKALNVIPTSHSLIPKCGTLIALGGAKGITFEVVKHLSQASRWNIHLIGRTPLTDPTISRSIEELKSHGSLVAYHCADATNRDELQKVFTTIFKDFPKVDLLIHGAGLEHSQSFDKRDTQVDSEEFESKVTTTKNLIKVTETFDIELQVLFSSVIAEFGNFGQSVYAFANKWAETLWTAPHLTHPNNRVVVQWPPWDGVGMTGKRIIAEILKSSGVSLIGKDKAVTLFSNSSFSKVNLIHNPADTLLYEGPLVCVDDMGVADPHIYPEHSELVLAFKLNPSDFPQLKDHAINNQVLLPLALSSFWFARIGEKLLGDSFHLIDFNIVRPLEVTSSVLNLSLRCQFTSDPNQPLCVRLWSEEFLIAQGTFSNSVKSALFSANPPLKSSLLTESLFPNPLFPNEYYCPKRLFHGPAFHFLEKVQLGTVPNIRGKLTFNSNLQSQNKELWNWIAIIDSGYQLLGLWALETLSWQGLPVGFKSITLTTHFTKANLGHWSVTETQIEENFIKANITLHNADGVPIGEIIGATYQKIKPQLC